MCSTGKINYPIGITLPSWRESRPAYKAGLDIGRQDYGMMIVGGTGKAGV